MSSSSRSRNPPAPALDEDWWAVIIGLGLLALAALLFSQGQSLKWLAVAPSKWHALPELAAQLQANGLRYLALFALWAALFSLGGASIGIPAGRFLPSFAIVFVVSAIIYAIGQWDQSDRYNLEP